MFRKVVTSEEELTAALRDINDRLERIESGALNNGVVSFGDTVQFAGVELTVRPGAGTEAGLVIELRNIATGERARLATLT